MDKWQERWVTNTDEGQWKKKLITDVRVWVQCDHRKLDYWLKQVLTRHGSFETYSKQMNISESDACAYYWEVDSM